MVNLAIAVALCKEFEGFRSKPYLCPAGVATIGYGTTRHMGGAPVSLTDPPIDKATAEMLLRAQLRRDYLPGALRACPVLATDERALNAIVDFCYNLGVGRLQTSTLRRRINALDWQGARTEIRRWVRGGGKILPGLVRRREAEAALLPGEP
jgi:lysozyme